MTTTYLAGIVLQSVGGDIIVRHKEFDSKEAAIAYADELAKVEPVGRISVLRREQGEVYRAKNKAEIERMIAKLEGYARDELDSLEAELKDTERSILERVEERTQQITALRAKLAAMEPKS